MDTLRFPLRFETNGEVSKLSEGTDEYFAQILALTAQIQPGELPLSPTFGVNDPVFNDNARRQLAFSAASQVPEVFVHGVDTEISETGKVDIKIRFGVRN
jgi:hypothetical protein